MLPRLTLPIFSLTCAVFHIHAARLLPRSSLASVDSSTSKAIQRDLDTDTVAQNTGVTCSPQSYVNRRGVTPRDGSIYGSSITDSPIFASGIQDTSGIQNSFDVQDNFVIQDNSGVQDNFGIQDNSGVQDNFGIQDNSGVQDNANLLALNTLLPAQNTLPVSDSQTVNSETVDPPDNQPIQWHNVFGGQDTDQATSTFSGNDILSDKPIDLSASTGNVALGNLDENNTGGNPDAIDYNGLVAVVQNPDTGVPKFPPATECIEYPPDNMYTVWEVIYKGKNTMSKRWEHAIIVASGFESVPPYIKYTIVRIPGTNKLKLGIIYNNVFIYKSGITPLSSLIRRGWLVVPEGTDKTVALDLLTSIADLKEVPRSSTRRDLIRSRELYWNTVNEHITATWAKYVFAKLAAQPLFWIQYNAPKL